VITFLEELKTLIDQGGLVLWFMLVLCIFLYTILASTWWGLFSLTQKIHRFGHSLDQVSSEALLRDEIELFELDQFAWVQRRLPVLSVLIALAPLCGLLGTVAGMLNTFAGMGNQNTIKPLDSISSGISQALITTQAGLLMAIPAAFLYALLKRHFETARGSLEQCATRRLASLTLAPRR
jgi:biopolymer transport protein ExbB/TolQ